MSYHLDWPWNMDQFTGFKDAMAGMKIEYRILEMDTKRHSSREWMNEIGKKARELIDTWHPDLVYTNDDNAQEYVAKFYVNKDIPFVFSAVNAPPETYQFRGSKNITGVLEREHFVETVRFLKEIVPGVRKIAVVVDSGPMWHAVLERMRAQQKKLKDVMVVHWDTIHTFDEYQNRMRQYQTSVDAVGLLGIFRFKDKSGKNVPYQTVLRWTAENSKLPDFSYWKDRIQYGTLCAVTVSGYQQGLMAGKMARRILLENKQPSGLEMKSSAKGVPVVSLARAKTLGIKIKTSILLTAEVIQKYKWED
jgi:ABC-type uncharacterized transport system substrate-binding protein